MAAPWVNLDVTPELGRPDPVAAALADTTAMRERVREASEQLAAVQHDVDELEREDVEATAKRARAGVTVFELAKVMGTSGRMIERHYGALLEGAHAGIAGRLDALEVALEQAAEDEAN